MEEKQIEPAAPLTNLVPSQPHQLKVRLNKHFLIILVLIIFVIGGTLAWYSYSQRFNSQSFLGPKQVSSSDLAAFRKNIVDKARTQAIKKTNDLASSINLSGGNLVTSSREDYCAEIDAGDNGDFSTHYVKDCSYQVILYVSYKQQFNALKGTIIPNATNGIMAYVSSPQTSDSCVSGDYTSRQESKTLASFAFTPFPPRKDDENDSCWLPLPASDDTTTLSGVGAVGPIFTMKQPLSYDNVIGNAKGSTPASFMSVEITSKYFSEVLR